MDTKTDEAETGKTGNETAPKKWLRLSRADRLFFRGVIVLLVLLTVVYQVTSLYAGYCLSKSRERAVMAGMPKDVGALTLRTIPDSENASSPLDLLTDDWSNKGPMAEAMEELGAYHGWADLNRPEKAREATPTAAQMQELEVAFESPPLKGVRTLVAQMANREDYVLSDDGMAVVALTDTTTWRHHWVLRMALRTVGLHAWVKANGGESQPAVRDFCTATSAARKLEKEPSLRSQTEAASLQADVVEMLQMVLRSPGGKAFSVDDLTTVADALRGARHLDGRPELQGAIGGAYLALESRASRIISGELDPMQNERVETNDEPEKTRIYRHFRVAILLDLSRTIDELVVLRERVNEADLLDLQAGMPHHAFPLDLASFPLHLDWQHTCQQVSTGEVQVAIAEMGVRVLAFQKEHGRYPTAEEVSAWEGWPEDPFVGKPVQYQVTADGYKIWGVGRDGVDNGGTRYQNVPNPGDLLWQIGDAVE